MISGGEAPSASAPQPVVATPPATGGGVEVPLITEVEPTVVQSPITIPQAPASVKTKVKKNKVTVSWRKIKKKQKALLAKINSIQVQYSTDPTFTQNVNNKVVGKKKTKVTISLQSKTTYYIRVRYVGSGGVSAWSGVKRVTTK